MNKLLVGFLFVSGLAAAGYMGMKVRATRTAPVAVMPGDHEPYAELAKGVQKYCLDNYQMESCLGYVAKCGVQCDSLLPKSLRVRILTDYNKFRIAKGEKPFIPPRAPANGQPEKQDAIRVQPIKSTLKSGGI